MKKRTALVSALTAKDVARTASAKRRLRGKAPAKATYTKDNPLPTAAGVANAEEARASRVPISTSDDPRVLKARIQMLEFELQQQHAIASQALQNFNAAADKLQISFKETRDRVYALQNEVEDKNRALDEKNTELQHNLYEKEKVKDYLASIFESLPVGVLVTDLEGGITSVNRAGQAMIGAAASELIGQNVNRLMAVHLAPRQEAVFELTEPLLYVRKDGETLKFQVSVTRMKGEGEQNTGYVVNLQDVTLLKKLEEHAERRNRFTVMGEMAANMAHEIRNPLGSIELFASLMRKGLSEGDERLPVLNHISSAVSSMNHIISNVLEYSKPRAVSLQVIDLHTLLEELVSFFRFMARQNNVGLDLTLDAARALVRADRELLKQALHNLLLNAVQAMPEGGSLNIATRVRTVASPQQLTRFGVAARLSSGETISEMDVVEVAVRDSGMGMTTEVQARIFDPFYTTKARGTGLGLAIVHTIVEAHHGTIDVQSAPGKGTTFALALPAMRE